MTTEITAEAIVALLKPKPIREWLSSLPPDQVVGKAKKACFCPIHNYLVAQGYPGVEIGTPYDLSQFRLNEKYYDLPDFAMCYAEQLDEEAPYSADEDDRNYYTPEISAELALSILDHVLERWFDEDGNERPCR